MDRVRAEDKVRTILSLTTKSGTKYVDLVGRILSEMPAKKHTYIVHWVKYKDRMPEFGADIGEYKGSHEAVAETVRLHVFQDIEEEDCQERDGIIKVSRVHGIDRKYTEKDMLLSWKVIFEHIQIFEEYRDGRTLQGDNKGLIMEALCQKYDIRENNFLSERYRRMRHRSAR